MRRVGITIILLLGLLMPGRLLAVEVIWDLADFTTQDDPSIPKLKVQYWRGAIASATCVEEGLVATANGYDGIVQLWEAKSRLLLREFDCASPVHSLHFASKGKYILAGCEDGKVIVWDAKTRRLVHVFDCNVPAFPIDVLEVGNDGTILVASHKHNTVCIGNMRAVSTRSNISNMESHLSTSLSGIASLALPKDCLTLACGGESSESQKKGLELWRIQPTKRLKQLETCAGVDSVEYSRSGDYLGVVCANQLEIRRPSDGTLIRTLRAPASNHCELVRFSPNGKYLLSAYMLRLWDHSSDREMFVGNEDIPIAFEVILWDLKSQKTVTRINVSGMLTDMAVSDNGSLISTLCGGESGYVAFQKWDVKKHKAVIFRDYVSNTVGDYHLVAGNLNLYYRSAGIDQDSSAYHIVRCQYNRAIKGNEVMLVTFNSSSGREVSASPIKIDSEYDQPPNNPGPDLRIAHQDVASILELPSSAMSAVMMKLARWRMNVIRGLLAGTDDKGAVHVFDLKSSAEILVVGNRPNCALLDYVFSPDGRELAVLFDDSTLQVYTLSPSAVRDIKCSPLPKHSAKGSIVGGTIEFSPDGKLVSVSGCGEVFDIATGNRIWTIPQSSNCLHGISFAHGDARVASSTCENLLVWSPQSGEALAEKPIQSISDSANMRYSMSTDPVLFEFAVTNRSTGLISDAIRSIRDIHVDSRGNLTFWIDWVAEELSALWRVDSVKSTTRRYTPNDWGLGTDDSEVLQLALTKYGAEVAWLSDGLAIKKRDGRVTKLTCPDAKTLGLNGDIVCTYVGRFSLDDAGRAYMLVEASRRGQQSGEIGYYLVAWDTNTGSVIPQNTVKLDLRDTSKCISSPVINLKAGCIVGLVSYERGLLAVECWDSKNGSRHDGAYIVELPKSVFRYGLSLSNDGKRVALSVSALDIKGDMETSVRVWDLDSTTLQDCELVSVPGVSHGIAFSSDDKSLLIEQGDGTIGFYDLASRSRVATFYSFTDSTWCVVDASGQYETSDGAHSDHLHWVVDNVPLKLDQITRKLFQSGLLAQLLGVGGKRTHTVSVAKELKFMPPKIAIRYNGDTGTAEIRLTARRDGGVGEVHVLINGNERNKPLAAAPKDKRLIHTIKLDLGDYTKFMVPGLNRIEIRAFNRTGNVFDRDFFYHHKAPPTSRAHFEPVPSADQSSDLENVQFYAVVGGVSNYKAGMGLPFAGKDAVSMASALDIAAQQLFKKNVHITLLTDEEVPGAKKPNKGEFEKAFEALRNVNPSDVVLIYLAGHGVSSWGSDSIYYYLTADSESADLSNEDVRGQSISSEELMRWSSLIPANHQILILDTCAAAAFGNESGKTRAAEGNRKRALQQLQDRTGFWLLSGCAEDRVSYEHPRYGHGLLTYALLEGMRGGALNARDELTVNGWFDYARNSVPGLASSIGGIQEPQTSNPSIRFGVPSYDYNIGIIPTQIRGDILLSQPRPLLLPPTILFEGGGDKFGLEQLLNSELSSQLDMTVREDSDSELPVYVDSDSMQGAVKPSGFYSVENDDIILHVYLHCDNILKDQFDCPGTVSGLQEFVSDVAAKIVSRAAKSKK